jgi:hypothetical protein
LDTPLEPSPPHKEPSPLTPQTSAAQHPLPLHSTHSATTTGMKARSSHRGLSANSKSHQPTLFKPQPSFYQTAYSHHPHTIQNQTVLRHQWCARAVAEFQYAATPRSTLAGQATLPRGPNGTLMPATPTLASQPLPHHPISPPASPCYPTLTTSHLAPRTHHLAPLYLNCMPQTRGGHALTCGQAIA